MDFFGPIQTRDMLRRMTIWELCATGALSCQNSALQIYPQIRYPQPHRQSGAASVSARFIIFRVLAAVLCHGTGYRILRRRSPDRYAAYYHDAVGSGIFVKVQVSSIPIYNESERLPKGYSCDSFFGSTITTALFCNRLLISF